MASRIRLHHFRPEGARSCHDQVARALGVEIIKGVYPPDSNLPTESELMDRFQVSRTVIREVMKTLTAKGLVVLKTRVGTRALHPVNWNFFDADLLSWRVELGLDEQFRENLTEIRLAVEPSAAAIAARRRSDEDVARLRDCIARMHAPGHTRQSFADADLEFHLAVAIASGNPLMRSISSVIEAALLAAFSTNSPVTDEDGSERTLAAHARIVDAIEAGDEDAARAAMIRVIDIGQQRMVANKARKPATPAKPVKKKARLPQ
jgi:DNA-binding FadR family transcriptional regulator